MNDFYLLLHTMVTLRAGAGTEEAPAPDALIAEAERLAERDPQAATAVLGPLVQLYPARADLRLALSTALAARGDAHGAAEQALAALPLAPDRLGLHAHLGRLARRADAPADFAARYTALIGTDGVLEEGGPFEDPDRLRNALDAAVALPERERRLLTLRAALAVFGGQPDAAIRLLTDALDATRDERAVRMLLAEAYELTDAPVRAALHRGHAAYVQGHPQAREGFRTALLHGELDRRGFRRYASICAQLLRFDDAISICRRGLVAFPDEDDLWYYLLYALIQTGRDEEARQTAAHAIRTGSRAAHLLHRILHLALPVVPASTAEIERARARFPDGIDALRTLADTASPEAGLEMLQFNNFYLAYHGEDDRALQERYGAFVHEAVARVYPQWMQPLPPHEGDRPLRVGFASPVMFNHTVSRFFLGWLQHRTPGAYEAYAYHLGDKVDVITNLFANAADYARGPFNGDIARIAEAIRRDELDVLVYLDIGQTATSLTLGALRLAPVQAAAWGHPVTTGLPNMDYFISSDLTEPPSGEAHYTETLVRLPGIGIATPRPRLFRPPPTRQAFGLPDDATVYLTPQSLYKYMPRFDELYPAIARRDPAALFVFFEHDVPNLTEQFYARLQRAFDAADVPIHEHVLLLPRRQLFGYLEAHALADVFLDNPTWSGGMTALDAIGMGLPIVTLAGPHMRSRQSTAYLTRIGLTELIAHDPEAFVDIAVRLGTNKAFREQMRTALRERQNELFNDTACIAGLESFFRRATERMAAA